MSEEVKVMFPDGRTTTLPRKTAESKDVKDIGGFIVEKVVKIPKHFAPIKMDEGVVLSAEDNAIAEGERIAAEAPKPRKKRGPNKKKH
jgi:hypothetical protein